MRKIHKNKGNRTRAIYVNFFLANRSQLIFVPNDDHVLVGRPLGRRLARQPTRLLEQLGSTGGRWSVTSGQMSWAELIRRTSKCVVGDMALLKFGSLLLRDRRSSTSSSPHCVVA